MGPRRGPGELRASSHSPGYAGFEAFYAENSGYPGLRSTTSSTPTRVGWVVAQRDDVHRWGSIKIVAQGELPVTILT